MSDLPKLSVKLEPSAGHVAVVPDTREEATASGIIIPDTASDKKSSIGTVYAVGQGKDKDGVDATVYSVGDRVVFGQYAGEEIELKDEDGRTVEVKFLSADSIRSKIS
ncbi:MAG: co-chaperone GroES [Candidatus Peribacteraceae bacterium]|jgi:chaperonin GroES|nr:co-chaperone GroES [Candidatus Peribacteraceae bacterium]